MPEEDVCAFDDQLSCEIVHCETKADQWTLMHRYNKAADFLEAVLQVTSSIPCASPYHPVSLQFFFFFFAPFLGGASYSSKRFNCDFWASLPYLLCNSPFFSPQAILILFYSTLFFFGGRTDRVA